MSFNQLHLTSKRTNIKRKNNILILDGGVSSHLLKTATSFPIESLWSSSLLLTKNGCNQIHNSHADFYSIGKCDILSALTYQCNYRIVEQGEKNILHENKLFEDKDVTNMLVTAVMICKDIVQHSGYVAASIGCYGGALADGSEYTGKYNPNIDMSHLIQFHQRKLQTLLSLKPDFIAFETIPNYLECKAILTLLKDNNINEKISHIWLSFACNDSLCLNDGTSFLQVLKCVDDMDKDQRLLYAIGFNCFDCQKLIPLIKVTLNYFKKTNIRRNLVFYPNTGEHYDITTNSYVPNTGCTEKNHFVNILLDALTLIHNFDPTIQIIVGGCCRTTPEMILLLQQNVNAF